MDTVFEKLCKVCYAIYTISVPVAKTQACHGVDLLITPGQCSRVLSVIALYGLGSVQIISKLEGASLANGVTKPVEGVDRKSKGENRTWYPDTGARWRHRAQSRDLSTHDVPSRSRYFPFRCSYSQLSEHTCCLSWSRKCQHSSRGFPPAV